MYATDTLVNERELVLRLIDGDEENLCELWPLTESFALHYTKFVKSRSFAEDIFLRMHLR